MKIARRIGEVYQEVGFWMTLIRALRKISRYIFTTNSAYWLERDLAEPIPDIDPVIPVKLTLFSKDETIAWFKEQKESWIYNPPEIACGLKEGHYFPNLKHEGRIIGYAKIGVGKVYIDDYKQEIQMAPRSTMCYDYYILPEYRGRFLSVYLIGEILKIGKIHGYNKALCHIPPWNITSVRIAEKLGFKKYKYVRHFRFFHFLRFWTTKKNCNEKNS